MAVVNTFQSVILVVRDVLRTEGITGTESMNHICLYVIARYMTIDRANAIGFPVKFAWENMMQVLQVNDGAQLAYDDFCDNEHKGDNTFLRQLDILFGTNSFMFSLENVHAHAKIMKAMDSVDLSAIDHEIDILGYVYEEHIRTGFISPRDLGQFFTDRAICKYMVNLCNPRIKTDGSLETVCDPTMGTGGFLTTAIKHYNSKGLHVDWRAQVDAIQGCDIDGKVAAIARMNMFMETGGACSTKLVTHNSLYMGLPMCQYDIILANIPFGLTNIDYKLCHSSVRHIDIKGSVPEPLFMQLIMSALARYGRAAVIVPSGFISNMDKQTIKTRRYLIEHFSLSQVIEMNKDDFFMNTSVGTYILFFSNEFATDITRVKRITRNALDGSIREETVGQIDCDDMIRKDFSLFLNHYTEQDIPRAPPGIDARVCALSDVCTIVAGKQIVVKTNKDKGLAIIMHKNIIDGHLVISDKQLYVAEDAPIKYIRPIPGDIVVSAVFDCGRCARVDAHGWILHNHIYLIRVINPDIVLPEYLFYTMYYGGFHERMRILQSGSTIQGIRNGDVKNYRIVVYSLDKQRQIIAEIDGILARNNELRARIAEIEQEIEKNSELGHRIMCAQSDDDGAPSPSSSS